MQLKNLFWFTLLHLTFADLLPRQHLESRQADIYNPGRTPKIVYKIVTLHNGYWGVVATLDYNAALSSSQQSAVGSSSQKIQDALDQSLKIVANTKSYNSSDSDHVATAMTYLSRAAYNVLDTIVEHKGALESSDLVTFACDNVNAACGKVQNLLSSFAKKATRQAARRVTRLEPQFQLECNTTTKALGCSGMT